MVLLYEPDPLDAWIGKRVEQQPGGALVHAETGGALVFCQRHTARNEEARLADKLFHIVDKYLPLQADETRAYIARFPGEVQTLLPKARKIRDAFRRQRGSSATTELEQAMHGGEENPCRAEDADADEGLPTPTTRGSATATERVRMESQGDDKTRETKEQPADTDTPPDWGGETDEEDPPTSWPWGEKGRPSDSGQSKGILAERPREPAGVPRPQGEVSGEEGRGIHLVPNRMWQNVRAGPIWSKLEDRGERRNDGGFSSFSCNWWGQRSLSTCTDLHGSSSSSATEGDCC